MTESTDAAFSRPASAVDIPTLYAPQQPGLTKLEYFAAAALTGILAADTDGALPVDRAARYAVKQAHALVAALNAEAEA